MSKRIESSKTGYVQRSYLTKQWATLMQSDEEITDNGLFCQIARRKCDALGYAKMDRANYPDEPPSAFDVRRVRVTLIVEDITDGPTL